MPDTFGPKTVAACRKSRACSWCAERIEVGQPYRGYCWSDSGSFRQESMHPECYDDMLEVSSEEGSWFEWMPGDFERPRMARWEP